MTKNFSKENVDRTLFIGQSLIGKTLLQVKQESDNCFTRTLYCSDSQSSSEASVLFFISKGVTFGCYFPTGDKCELVNTPLAERAVKAYQSHCNLNYEPYEMIVDCWCNGDSKTFIQIFFDVDENCYMLNIMEMSEN